MRRKLYKLARLLGDLQAISSGKPRRIVKRAKNKWIGRKIVRRLFR